jgi:hypothetical protein
MSHTGELRQEQSLGKWLARENTKISFKGKVCSYEVKPKKPLYK